MAKVNTTFGFTDNLSNPMNRAVQSIQNATGGLSKLSSQILGVNQAIQLFQIASNKIKSIQNNIDQLVSAYTVQQQAEIKLTTIMRQRMNASNDEIQSMKNLASEMQKVGIYGDEMVLTGMQELATFSETSDAVKTLTPALTNLVAQQYGYGASAEQMRSAATMMGKVLGGQAGGLTRYGYVLTDAEKKIIETGTEMERANTIAQVITNSVGNMNQALAGTSTGALMKTTMSLGDMREEVGRVIQPLSNMIKIFTSNLKIKWYQTVINSLNFIREHIVQVTIVLGGLVVSLGAVGVAFLVLKRKAIASAVATAVAWGIANAPMLATIGIIILIISAITALALLFAKFTPQIVGFFGGIGGVIKEFGAQAKHVFQILIENVVNGFLTMRNKVIDLYITMFTTLLTGVEKVAQALDKVFGSNLASNVSNFKDTLNGLKMGEANFKLGWEDNRQGFKNAWNSGQEVGKQIGTQWKNNIEELGNNLKNKLNADKSQYENGEDKFNFDGNGNLLTADKNMIDIADDYKELLSKKAYKNFDLQFSQVTPQVSIDNVNVSNGIELADVVDVIVDGMEQAQSSSLRG